MRKALVAAATAIVFTAPGLALAEDSPHSFTGNVGLFSQYVFRGLTQTNEDPAVQGGFDYAYNFGPASLYLGTWASNISWLRDSGQYTSSSLEWDFYGGVKGNIGATDFTYDVGYLFYYYPGDVAPGGVRGNTQEVYGALGWKWFTVKYSYSVDNKTFAVQDSRGTWYLDLSASVPLGDTGFTAFAHWGKQEYDGTDPRNAGGASNDSLFSYEDWKVGVSYAVPSGVLKDLNIGAYYTDTNANDAGYTINGKNIGDSQFVVYVQKFF